MNGRVLAASQRMIIGSLTLSLALNATLLPAWSAQKLKNPKKPLVTELKTELDGSNTTQGKIFEAELKEDVLYRKWTLPSGTVFRGSVTKVQHSRHLGRPGYMILNVEEAQLPGGDVYTFDPQQYKPREAKTHDKNSQTFMQTAVEQLPASLAGLGATLPLTLATSASGVAMIPVGVGVRMLTGATQAMFQSRYKQMPPAEKIARGSLDGSGIGRVLSIMSKYPEPLYKEGDNIRLHFNPKALRELFIASANSKSSALATPIEPTGPMVEPPQKQLEDGPENLVKTPQEQPHESATFP